MSGASATLPTALHGWAAAFHALRPDVALALAPLLHRLDELVSRHGDADARHGEPAGLAGLSTHGSPEHLLVSEWLLAEEAPEEFLRRAAQHELLHHEAAFRHDPPAGATRVVVDCGPSQAGAARLVQLAALVVLHRRARTRGADLEIGFLGEPATLWHTGDLPHLLDLWLRARAVEEPAPAHVRDRHAEDPRAWHLIDPALATALGPSAPPARRVLAAQERDWDAAGATAVEVALAGERVHLPLPAPTVAVRVLRGNGWRRPTGTPVDTEGERFAVRHARFHPASRWLVGRGTDPGEVVTVHVSSDVGDRTVRTHRFAGRVLAAAASGRRLVVLHELGGALRVSRSGGPVPGWDELRLPLHGLGLDEVAVRAAAEGPLWVQHQALAGLWVRTPGGWLEVQPSGAVVPHPDAVVVRPSSATGAHVRATVADGVLRTGRSVVDGIPEDAPVLASDAWVAVEREPGCWTLVDGLDARHELRTGPGDVRPVGVVVVDGEPRLVTPTVAGLMTRLVGPRATSTLPSPTLERRRVAVHPSRPLVAFDTGDGALEIHDVAESRRVRTCRGSLA